MADPWFHHMSRGDFDAAWQINDQVRSTCDHHSEWKRPRHQQIVWDGRSLAGHVVLVRCYHGLGDTVQFIRYAEPLRQIAREVIVWAQPELIPLLHTASGIDRLIPLHDGTPPAEYERDVEVMELPYVFRSTLDTLPRRVPYLQVMPQPRLNGETLHVGLVWSAGGWDARRSIPLECLEPLWSIDGLSWHILQRGPALREWSRPITHGGSDSVMTTASIMASLDLVISVDSFPAHLAGALGLPTWTLLHTEADWRWMRDRDDSPWYPTMRLFRQTRAGQWNDVVHDVCRRLEAWKRSTREPHARHPQPPPSTTHL